jgi:hypothetical protein
MVPNPPKHPSPPAAYKHLLSCHAYVPHVLPPFPQRLPSCMFPTHASAQLSCPWHPRCQLIGPVAHTNPDPIPSLLCSFRGCLHLGACECPLVICLHTLLLSPGNYLALPPFPSAYQSSHPQLSFCPFLDPLQTPRAC